MRPQTLYLWLFLLFACSISGCKKDKAPLESLPAATQEGKNTLGCLVDGRAFARKQGLVDFMWRVELVFGNSYGSSDRYILNLKSSKEFRSSRESIWIYGDSVLADNNITYPLEALSKGAFTARYMDDNLIQYVTTDDVKGQLIFTKIDLINAFVAGTFSFTGVSPAGDTVRVTDGRFDLRID